MAIRINGYLSEEFNVIGFLKLNAIIKKLYELDHSKPFFYIFMKKGT